LQGAIEGTERCRGDRVL
jgi:hypothetical protein